MKPQIETGCAAKCTQYQVLLDECAKRIEGKGEGYDCTGQAQDLWKCIDHCAQGQIFNYIK